MSWYTGEETNSGSIQGTTVVVSSTPHDLQYSATLLLHLFRIDLFVHLLPLGLNVPNDLLSIIKSN